MNLLLKAKTNQMNTIQAFGFSPIMLQFLNGCIMFRTGSFQNRIMLSTLLLLTSYPLMTDAGALPNDFSIRFHSTGADLIWTPVDKSLVRMGGSRSEYRLSDGTVVGYPRENVNEGFLSLPMTKGDQTMLAKHGENLQVWIGRRRVDVIAPSASRVSQLLSTVVANNTTSTPTVNINPASPGNYTATRLSYHMIRGLNYSKFDSRIEVLAEVKYPIPFPIGKSPLVLFLHGRHATCYDPSGGFGCNSGWPCDPGCRSIPSHLGYRYIANILASQGYIAISISANGINGQDFVDDGGAEARSLLIRRHLDLWARWNVMGGDPWGGRFRGKVDMNNVVLVGHSRGGEGVNRAAVDVSASSPYKIVGLVTYGPTAFGKQVTPDVHSATILPTCDGDVSDLQGQTYIDRSRDIAYSEALRSAVISIGTNHNFFNTEWTPGLSKGPSFDDWFDTSDPVCGKKGTYRLTPQEQQLVGATYTMALVRLAVYQDTSMLPLLDGSYVKPESIGRAEVVTHAVGGAAHRLLYSPENLGAVKGTSGMKAGECSGYYDIVTVLPKCDDSDDWFGSSPHWTNDFKLPSPQAAILEWTKTGATAIFTISDGIKGVDLSTLDSLDVRVANDPKSQQGAQFKLMIQDNLSRTATLNTSITTINGWLGTGQLDRVHARAFRGYLKSVPPNTVDLKNIVSVFLVAQSSSGKVYVLDIAASQARVAKPVNLDLPVITFQSVNVPEGNGLQAYQMKVISDKPLKAPGSIWVTSNYGTGFQLNLTAGGQSASVLLPITWVGDTSPDSLSFYSQYLVLGAMKGVVTGNYVGRFNLIEDDPYPTISVQQQVTAVEGKNLVWNFQSSSNTVEVNLFCLVVPPVTGLELYSFDVSNDWLLSLGVTPPSTSRPLSSLGLYVIISFPIGAKSASLVIPIEKDIRREGTERIILECPYGEWSNRITLIGSVLAHNATL